MKGMLVIILIINMALLKPVPKKLKNFLLETYDDVHLKPKHVLVETYDDVVKKRSKLNAAGKS